MSRWLGGRQEAGNSDAVWQAVAEKTAETRLVFGPHFTPRGNCSATSAAKKAQAEGSGQSEDEDYCACDREGNESGFGKEQEECRGKGAQDGDNQREQNVNDRRHGGGIAPDIRCWKGRR